VATAQAGLTAVGLGLDALRWWSSRGVLSWRHLASIALALALLALLQATRQAPRAGLASAAFLANNAAILATLWWGDDQLIHLTPHWRPFDPQNLGALTVALLAPPEIWVGLTAIAGFALLPLVEFFHWEPALQEQLSMTAPWASVAYGVFACGLYAHQLGRHELQQRLAQAEASERFARILLAVRDLTNTPLQTLQITASLLRARDQQDRLVQRLGRTTDRLVEISHLLDRYENEEARLGRSDEAFDARKVLEPPPRRDH
jgi:hypothetical protein